MIGVGVGLCEVAIYARAGEAMINYWSEDGATSPWYLSTTPPGIFDAVNNRIVMGYEAWHADEATRIESIVAYDVATGKYTDPAWAISANTTDDDHSVPAIGRDSLGYIWVFGGVHIGSMAYSISFVPDDYSHFRDKTALSAVADGYTYPHPSFVNNGSGEQCYLFLREKDTPNNRYYLALRKTTAMPTTNGATPTWAAQVRIGDLGDDSRWYQGPNIVVGTEIWMVGTMADFFDNWRRHSYILRYDTVTGAVKNFDASFTTSTFPIGLTDLNANFRVHETPAGNGSNTNGFCLDAAGRPHLIFIEGPDGVDDGDFAVYHKYWNGSAWVQDNIGNSTHRYNGCSVGKMDDGTVRLFWEEDTAGIFARGGVIRKRVWNTDGTYGATSTIINPERGFALSSPFFVQGAPLAANLMVMERAVDPATESNLRSYLLNSDGNVVKKPAGRPKIITRMTATQDATHTAAINLLEEALLDLDVLQNVDYFYVLAAADVQAACLNWAANRYNLANIGPAAFTANSGFLGVTTPAGYLDMGIIRQGYKKIKSSNCLHGWWVMNNTTSAQRLSGKSGGSGASNGADYNLIARNASNEARLRLGTQNGTELVVTGITESRGHWVGTRTALIETLHRDNVQLGQRTDAPAATGTEPITSGQLLRNGSSTAQINHRLGIAYGGSYDVLDAVRTETDAAIRAYLTTLGAI